MTSPPRDLVAVLAAERNAGRKGRAAMPALIRARREALNHPEPPRDSGEADAVHGPTALRTHDGPATAGSSHASRRLEATGSRAGDNTLERSTAGPDARP